MLSWANRFSIFCFLDHAVPEQPGSSFDCLLGAGVTDFFSSNRTLDYTGLRAFAQQEKRWLFGHLAYPSARQDARQIPFEPQFFFQPQYVIALQGNECRMAISARDAWQVFQEIEQCTVVDPHQPTTGVSIQAGESPESYKQKIESLLQHMHRGDCYEVNYCQYFQGNNFSLDPIALYGALAAVSPNPFSACYKLNDRYCLCASPERYLQLEGNRVISQPIKGTSPRFPADPEADALAASTLRNSVKEQRENVMVVDLVRNDLSRVCVPGSVRVSELFGIYAFPQVFQMISTVEGIRQSGINWVDVVEATFPMGSMTGAPKVRVMELIEQYETMPRGLFSGTIGYITPEGNADFNVVIRSLFYHARQQQLEYFVGSGITAYCDPQAEFEECNWKAAAIRRILFPAG